MICSSCGSKISVLWSMTVQEIWDYAQSTDAIAGNGRLRSALDVLRNNGGCNSCIRTIEEKIRTNFQAYRTLALQNVSKIVDVMSLFGGV